MFSAKFIQPILLTLIKEVNKMRLALG